jgi:lycopene beta-cyclase
MLPSAFFISMNHSNAPEFDFIICGGGISGMLLAFFLSQSEILRHKKILVLERNYPGRFERNFSFWHAGNHPFDPVIEKKWSRFGVYFEDFSREFELQDYKIQYFKSAGLFKYLDSLLLKNANFHILRAEVFSCKEQNEVAIVTTDRGDFKGNYVFDSIKKSGSAAPIVMQGFSWLVRPEKENFDETRMTLFDFRRSSGEFVNFYYSLPLSEGESIFYLAGFTPRDFEFDDSSVEKGFRGYLEETQKIKGFAIENIDRNRIEFSALPKTRPGSRIIPIGAKAGLVQKSTSYGFVRIMENSELIVRSLEAGRNPSETRKTKLFYRVLDYLTMRLMAANPQLLRGTYRRLFKNLESGDLMFKFLDEKTTPAENFQMLKVLLKLDPKSRV